MTDQRKQEKRQTLKQDFRDTFICYQTGKYLENETTRIQVYTKGIENYKLKVFCWRHGFGMSNFIKKAAMEMMNNHKKNKNKKLKPIEFTHEQESEMRANYRKVLKDRARKQATKELYDSDTGTFL